MSTFERIVHASYTQRELDSAVAREYRLAEKSLAYAVLAWLYTGQALGMGGTS